MAEKENMVNMVKLRFEHNGQMFEASISEDLASQLQSPNMDNGTKLSILQQIAASLGAGSSRTAVSSIEENTSVASSLIVKNTDAPSTDSASLIEINTDAPSTDSAAECIVKFWKEDEERALISIRTEMNSLFLSGCKDHGQLWLKVQKKLSDLEISATITQIMNKWNQLKKRYKDVKDHNNKTGNNTKVFKFMEEFDNLYGDKASTSPQFTMESNTSSDTSSDSTKPNHASQSKAKKRTISSQDRQISLMEEMLEATKGLSDDAKEMHKAKMERMDRFLDIFQKSMDSNKD